MSFRKACRAHSRHDEAIATRRQESTNDYPHPNCGRPTGHRSDEDTALDTFTVRLPRWRFAQLFGFNPLVRIGDRVEALVVVLAVVISVIAVPIAAAVGTVVYDSRSRQYAERAQISRVVTGTVTSLKVAYHESLGPTITVLARWVDGGTEHTGAVSAPRGVTIGDSIDIWVGEDGSHVGPPPKPLATRQWRPHY